MSDQLIVERTGLEKKDKSELQAIVAALGGSASSRARKAELIDQILELSGAALPAEDEADAAPEAESDAPEADAEPVAESEPSGETSQPDAETPDAAGEAEEASEAAASESEASQTASTDADSATKAKVKADAPTANEGRTDNGGRSQGGGRGRRGGRNQSGSRADSSGSHPVGSDGEPLADWEVDMLSEGNKQGGGQGEARSGGQGKDRNRGDNRGQNQNEGRNQNQNEGRNRNQNEGQSQNEGRNQNNNRNDDANQSEDADPNNRRSRRRGRGRGRDRDDAGNEPVSTEPVSVSGSLDLRDEGYGFLRVDGYLPSKEDVYVSVKQVRQYGLRKGDHLTGQARPANRNEKNPGFHQIESVNGSAPEEAKKRPRFDDLTPLFPDEPLVMAMREEPLNMTTRIIDLVCPIGKGQRGLIVSPPKAGKTTVMKDIARAVETNNPDVHLIVLLLDERPEEVTDMRRHLKNGEVAASTFDRPPEEHCAVAELTIERAKRLVETGADVCLIVDGITRLSRAYNLTAPQSGRAMSGGLDAAALYPPKRFFGAARNLEEGGSLTILATALVETGSKMDDVIFEEFKGTGNMELRLDRRLAEKRVFPAIDIDGSSTRHEELLFDKKELQLAWKLRRVLSSMAEDGSSAAGVEMLIDRLTTFKTNADFLSEIAKAPTV